MNRERTQRNAAAPGPDQTRRSLGLALVVGSWAFGVLLSPCIARAADSSGVLEYKVKGGYLLNFARFIEWPAGTFPSADSPFIIDILDGGEALPVLQALLIGKKVDTHPVQVRAVQVGQLRKDAHILLATRAGGKSPEELKSVLGGAATLLVGETEQFAEQGGMVGFTREDESIRLSLNLERATEVGLKISSKLCSVAKVVKTKRAK